VRFDLRLAFDDAALNRSYPSLARALRRQGKVMRPDFELLDEEGCILLRATSNREGSALRLQVRARNNLLLPLVPSGGGIEHALDMTSGTPRALVYHSDHRRERSRHRCAHCGVARIAADAGADGSR